MQNSSILTCIRIVFLVVFIQHVIAQKDAADCTTPNNEQAKCISIRSCKIILDAIKERSEAAIKFARDSQCGFRDSVPFVCCGSTAFPSSKGSSDDIYALFNVDQEKRIDESEQVVLSSFKTNELPDRSVCGFEKNGDRRIGSEQASLDEFPWLVALEYVKKKDKSYAGIKCGGSLINNRYVLTAARCVLHRELEVSNVRLGERDITKDPDCITVAATMECADKVVKINISESIPHPFYSNRGSNDIALLKLADEVAYTNYIRPICLPSVNLRAPPFNTPITIAGWGITENNPASDIKLKINAPLLNNEKCKEKLQSKTLVANQLCVDVELAKDSCGGDSGGPLVRPYEDANTKQTQWYQEGVISQAFGCTRSGLPYVYTRVSRYINWIINTISTEDN